MNSQLARRPNNQRPTRSVRAKKYVKQTAHVEARRDGKPLIFGWGGHLSRTEKTRLERRIIWTATAIIGIFIVAVFVAFWVNLNVITPNRPIMSVNGENVPQSDYRKMVAIQAQFHANKLYGPHGLTAQRDSLKAQVADLQKTIDTNTKQVSDLQTKIKQLPAGASTQRTDLENQLKTANTNLTDAQTKQATANAQYQDVLQNQIPQEQQLYTQPQAGNDSSDWLQQDALIRQWVAKQSTSVQTQVEPSPNAINQAVKDFTANLPKTTSYKKFLSDDGISDADVHAMLSVQVRRDNAQKYLATQVNSPTYQVLARAITTSTQADAQKVLQRLKNGEDFGKVAKEKSVDTNTKDKGGDLGWLARGQYTLYMSQKVGGTVDNWIFDPARKLNELSPILSENGTYHIVQVMGTDPAKTVDSTTLKDLKDNALIIWILSQKALPGTKITPSDQNMMFDASNMPPGLPASPPQQQQPGSNGLPGSLPGSGGLPGQ